MRILRRIANTAKECFVPGVQVWTKQNKGAGIKNRLRMGNFIVDTPVTVGY